MTELTEKQKEIVKEIESARKSIKTDGYSMSIGELISLYKEGEIKLDPAFQRLFRWEDHQKTKLIESIIIGIPIPEVFVAQKNDGNWHVVDGVQRLSTIFQLVGILEGVDPLTLTTCKYIPSLEGQNWEGLPVSTQREFRKSKLKINIILTQNSDESQFELFQRLNTGGTNLEPQEVRNCLILMISTDFYQVINELKEYENFKKCLTLKTHHFEKEFHMELILRMYIGYAGLADYSNHGSMSNIILDEFIDKETINLIKENKQDEFSIVFKKTFDKLYNAMGNDCFKKYDEHKGTFSGSFNISAFEAIASGVAKNISTVSEAGDQELRQKIINLYSVPEVEELISRGKRAIIRFKGLTSFSKKYFSSNG